ncbi:MAG: (Fe-S)-binding protein [Clostridiales bacterium]|nr:(Fe-S)-binding protein [Clostridiales bacterium]MCF8022023.1 (Fe-S)-binding protein [Clostridiales bacterium]
MEAKKLDPNFRDEVINAFATENDPSDLYNCLTCGMCTAGCPFNGVHDNADPRKLIRKVMLGMKEEVLNDWFIWACTQCGRCTMQCPMNVDIAGLVRTIRGNFGLRAPGFLQDIVDSQVNTGNQMEVSKEDYLDTLEWMEEETQMEIDDTSLRIPIDEEGADIMFLWDPREIKYYPLDIQSIAMIMHAAGASWTSPSNWWDATHYGLFNGDDQDSATMLKRISEEVQRLKPKYVVVTECGHAMRAQSWGRKVWLDPKTDGNYPVYWLPQMEAYWIQKGIIKVDPSNNPDPVTLHDPCNAVRKEGIEEEPRICLNNACADFREMWPNGKWNICCGGGGGLLSMGSDIQPYRMAKGKLKADQIKETGAKIVASPCHNCFDQLSDINKHYKLGVEIKHIHHLVSNALVFDK